MKATETFKIGMKGRWRDRYEYVDGPRKGQVVVTPWYDNQIQNDATLVVAGLFSRRGEDPDVFPAGWNGYTGISYMAVGEGLVGWDVVPPVQDPADSTLTTEFYRKSIGFSELGFVDLGLPPGSPHVFGPTRKIQATCTFLPAEGNGPLREFALFGGLADGTTDSGHMINWVVHPLINKDATLVLTRTVEIEFLLP